jgi:hypothetical protein
MNSTKGTLDNLAKLVDQKAISAEAAIQTAYRIGKLQGSLEMAQVGQKIAEAA